MDNNRNKPYNLEERTLEFAKDIINLCKKLSKDIINTKIVAQLIDASGSVGANYREANEKLSKKDFLHRMKITRKECKESTYWLELLKEADKSFIEEINNFIKESQELRNIFTSIINKSK
jgi:four helix bundle protein